MPTKPSLLRPQVDPDLSGDYVGPESSSSLARERGRRVESFDQLRTGPGDTPIPPAPTPSGHSPADGAARPLRRLVLVVEYDGTQYAGFQLQTGRCTIQGEMERALARFTGETIRIRAASRTDSGAHAKGQVVDFLTHSAYPVEYFPRALNFYLPSDIQVQAAYEVGPEFHSRKYATSRTYRYYILNNCWPSPLRRYTHHWVKNPLDVAKMAAAARSLVGGHDFGPLSVGTRLASPANRSTVRTVSRWDVWREDDTVIIECEANGFLRHQIRRANALLIEIGKGRWPEGMINDVLDGKLTEAIEWPSLPARGLCLMKVTYPNLPPCPPPLVRGGIQGVTGQNNQ